LKDDANHETGERVPLDRGYDSSPIQLRNPEADDVSVNGRERDSSSEGDGCSEAKVWEYDGLAGYRVVGGVPEVAVRWRFTWEPAADFPPDKVAGVRKKWQRRRNSALKELRSKKQPEGRRKPRQRLRGSAAPAVGTGL
jgi:hypothetical protein